jgi:hypothetical protein
MIPVIRVVCCSTANRGQRGIAAGLMAWLAPRSDRGARNLN